jgi:hypothetical protein
METLEELLLVKATLRGSSAKAKKARSKINKKIEALMSERRNYMPSCQVGCHVAHFNADWVLGVEDIDMEDFGFESEEELRATMSDISIGIKFLCQRCVVI